MTSSNGFSCGLGPVERAEQAQRWREQRAFSRGSARTATGFRVAFDRDRPELEALVEVERGCCGWADWSVTDGPDGTVLEVTGPPAEVASLADALGY